MSEIPHLLVIDQDLCYRQAAADFFRSYEWTVVDSHDLASTTVLTEGTEPIHAAIFHLNYRGPDDFPGHQDLLDFHAQFPNVPVVVLTNNDVGDIRPHVKDITEHLLFKNRKSANPEPLRELLERLMSQS